MKNLQSKMIDDVISKLVALRLKTSAPTAYASPRRQFVDFVEARKVTLEAHDILAEFLVDMTGAALDCIDLQITDDAEKFLKCRDAIDDAFYPGTEWANDFMAGEAA
jgi:hypothetical protein